MLLHIFNIVAPVFLVLAAGYLAVRRDLIADHTRGIPRLVNKLCDFAMVYAATEERKIVDAAIIEEVLEDGIFLPAVTSTGEAAE